MEAERNVTAGSLSAAANAKPLRPLKTGKGLLVAVLTVALAFLVRYALQPWLDERVPLILFTVPVLVCGIYFGRTAANLAAVLSIGAGGYAFAADGAMNTADVVQLLTFAAVCAGIIVLSYRVLRAQRAETGQRKFAEAQHARALRTSEEIDRKSTRLNSSH